MPIRSPRGRAAAYRAFWEWPLRSPVRLAVSLVAVLALAVGISVAAGTLSGGSGGIGLVPLPPPGSTSRAAVAPTTVRGMPRSAAVATPRALPPVAELSPSALPLSQAPAEALSVASSWTAAWVRPPDGTTAQQWVEGLRATTTEEYLGLLAGVDPGNIPATRVTGEPRPVRVSARSVEVQMPTDAVTLLVLVVDTGSGWRVSDSDRL